MGRKPGLSRSRNPESLENRERREREISRFAKTETSETESLGLKNRDLGLGTGKNSLQYILQYQSLLTFYEGRSKSFEPPHVSVIIES